MTYEISETIKDLLESYHIMTQVANLPIKSCFVCTASQSDKDIMGWNGLTVEVYYENRLYIEIITNKGMSRRKLNKLLKEKKAKVLKYNKTVNFQVIEQQFTFINQNRHCYNVYDGTHEEILNDIMILLSVIMNEINECI